MSTIDPLSYDDPPPVKHTLSTAKFEAVNGPSTNPTSEPTDVHQILRANLTRENAAGMNDIKPVRKRGSRRKRDFWTILIGGNLLIAASVGLTRINPVTVIYGFSGIILLSAGLTWIMWFVMDDY
jgi:hypothetical protein